MSPDYRADQTFWLFCALSTALRKRSKSCAALWASSKSVREQVLDAVELDAELAGLEVDVRGQGGDLVAGLGAEGDFHRGGPEVFANAFELGHQPPTPALPIAERLAVSQGFELLDQLLAVEEEGFAGLVAAEAVEQLDGLAAFEAEELFDHGTVEDGDREPAEFLDDAGKVKQLKGLRRQGGFPYLLYVTTQLCGMGVFRGLE